MSTDAAFGGDEALVDLIRDAKKINIGIILDGVFNHTGADSVYFNKFSRYKEAGAYQSKSSPFYDWYEFKNYPDDYVSWWGIEILPRINPSVPSCADFIAGEGGVVDKYASLGILGLRLDVVDELSDEFISRIKDRLLSHSKNAVLYGEVWEDASNKIAYGKRKKYYLGRELDGVMNYPLRGGIINYIRNSDTKELFFALSDIINNAPKEIADLQMNLLGTHDTERIITALCGESPEGKTNAQLREIRISSDSLDYAEKCVINAFTILFTLPGIPSVYYGDEAGLEGYSDPFNRMPYPWGKENGRILSSVIKLGNLRKLRAYKNGEFELCHIDSSLLIFKRADRSSYITLYNNSENSLEIEFNTPIKILFGEVLVNNSLVVVPAKTACIIKSSKNNTFKINY
jgi:glycosidase